MPTEPPLELKPVRSGPFLSVIDSLKAASRDLQGATKNPSMGNISGTALPIAEVGGDQSGEVVLLIQNFADTGGQLPDDARMRNTLLGISSTRGAVSCDLPEGVERQIYREAQRSSGTRTLSELLSQYARRSYVISGMETMRATQDVAHHLLRQVLAVVENTRRRYSLPDAIESLAEKKDALDAINQDSATPAPALNQRLMDVLKSS